MQISNTYAASGTFVVGLTCSWLLFEGVDGDENSDFGKNTNVIKSGRCEDIRKDDEDVGKDVWGVRNIERHLLSFVVVTCFVDLFITFYS